MAQHTVLLGRLLATFGHEVLLLTTRHPDGIRETTDEGVETHFLAETRPGSQRGGWWPASARAFGALHRTRAFDIVVSQSTGAAGLVGLPRVARPSIVSVVHGTTPQMLTSILHALRRQGARARGRSARKLLSSTVGMWSIDRPLYTASDMLVMFSEVVETSVRRWFPSAAGRLRRVPYAIDLARFAPDAERRRRMRATLGFADTDMVLLAVGVLTAQKGVDVAIEALALASERRPGVALVVVGDGDAAPDLRDLARRRGVAHAVRFVGAVSNAATADYYNAADVLVMPTLRVESFGLVLAEAMACALPVVVSRIGATPAVVVDGHTGVLVRPGDPVALAAAVTTLVADPVRCQEMGQAGRRHAVEHCDPVTHGRAIEALLWSVIGCR